MKSYIVYSSRACAHCAVYKKRTSGRTRALTCIAKKKLAMARKYVYYTAFAIALLCGKSEAGCSRRFTPTEEEPDDCSTVSGDGNDTEAIQCFVYDGALIQQLEYPDPK